MFKRAPTIGRKKDVNIMSVKNNDKETKKSRGAKKVRKAGKKQRRKKISKSGKTKVAPKSQSQPGK